MQPLTFLFFSGVNHFTPYQSIALMSWSDRTTCFLHHWLMLYCLLMVTTFIVQIQGGISVSGNGQPELYHDNLQHMFNPHIEAEAVSDDFASASERVTRVCKANPTQCLFSVSVPDHLSLKMDAAGNTCPDVILSFCHDNLKRMLNPNPGEGAPIDTISAAACIGEARTGKGFICNRLLSDGPVFGESSSTEPCTIAADVAVRSLPGGPPSSRLLIVDFEGTDLGDNRAHSQLRSAAVDLIPVLLLVTRNSLDNRVLLQLHNLAQLPGYFTGVNGPVVVLVPNFFGQELRTDGRVVDTPTWLANFVAPKATDSQSVAAARASAAKLHQQGRLYLAPVPHEDSSHFATSKESLRELVFRLALNHPISDKSGQQVNGPLLIEAVLPDVVRRVNERCVVEMPPLCLLVTPGLQLVANRAVDLQISGAPDPGAHTHSDEGAFKTEMDIWLSGASEHVRQSLDGDPAGRSLPSCADLVRSQAFNRLQAHHAQVCANHATGRQVVQTQTQTDQKTENVQTDRWKTKNWGNVRHKCRNWQRKVTLSRWVTYRQNGVVDYGPWQEVSSVKEFIGGEYNC